MPRTRFALLSVPAVAVVVALVAVGTPPGRARSVETSPAFSERTLATGARGQVVLADVDGDKRPEPVLVGEDARVGKLVPGGPPVRAIRMKGSFGPVAFGDLDGDGALDAVSQDLERQALQIVFGDGRGGFGAPVFGPKSGPFESDGLDVTATDLDGDGRNEVIVMTVGFREGGRPTSIGVTRVDAQRRIGRPNVLPATPRSSRVQPADLDGDGDVDLVTDAVLFLNTGGGEFAAPKALPQPRSTVPGAGGEPVYSVVRGREVLQLSAPANQLTITTVARDGVVKREVPRTAGPASAYGEGEEQGPYIGSGAQWTEGLGLTFSGGDALWVVEPTADGGWRPAVPTFLPGQLALGELTGDARPDAILLDPTGRLRLLAGTEPRPSAVFAFVPAAPRFADGTARVVLTCTAGAGGCQGTVGRALISLPARKQMVLRPRAKAVSALNVAVDTSRGRKRATVALRRPTPADRHASCADGTRLAASARHTVLGFERGVRACDRRTGAWETLTGDAAPTAAGTWGPYVAAVYDVCPGGFEGCWLAVGTTRHPGAKRAKQTILSTSVSALAVGRGGAMAAILCPPGGEDPSCAFGRDDRYEVIRVAGRRRVALGKDVNPRSLRTEPGGRRFSWIQGERRHSAPFAAP
jgi:hypothetical protein